MEEALLNPQDVERAKMFWAGEDVDEVFDTVFVYLEQLKRALKKNTATDKELIQALKLLESLDLTPPVSSQDPSVVQVVIGSDGLLPGDFPSPSSSPLPFSNGVSSPTVASAGREKLLPPLVPVQLQYQLHSCSKACLPSVASMSQSKFALWGQNPLKVPLLCGFKRLSAWQPMSYGEADDSADVGVEPMEEQDMEDSDVVYKAPCGQSLRNHGDVMQFLVTTECYDILQVDLFTFNPCVRLDPPSAAGPRWPDLDLSRGMEATPIELCPGEGGAWPPDFRYRKDRWPHGCFLNSGPTLFKVCCDCTDGCLDAEHCACIAMARDGHHYTYQRLAEPVASGLYECGPWCNCDRSRCQNRVVQKGIRVRLQVFQTDDKGWAVRCCDDLDRGTFVCIYAGVVLRKIQSPDEPPLLKTMRCDLPSDDEVEVVTEWLAPAVVAGSRKALETSPPVSPSTSHPLHVPVIQSPNDTTSTTPQDRNKVQMLGVTGQTLPSTGVDKMAGSCSSGDQPQPEEKAADVTKVESNKQKMLKRTTEEVHVIDATKEGNVSRFINHSCQPNLFIQNVFTDSHDPGFPVIAFFTSRVVKAGTELTWDYSAHRQTTPHQKQDVPCLCGSSGCQGQFPIEEKLCDMCEAEVPAMNEAH
ncbi:histone-lysine N-methyltransferase SETDB2 isoform X2 [Betta splendens]|uniref:Histone-lysine N-methyltransferase SETDB2 n=1 Tax=Betta splendens TaxID=158456 RepID=A0A9W2XKM6_BETSP|nr:histone-lysine N-methyltransferase SETDB2 isoform X2 [Betta splendens]